MTPKDWYQHLASLYYLSMSSDKPYCSCSIGHRTCVRDMKIWNPFEHELDCSMYNIYVSFLYPSVLSVWFNEGVTFTGGLHDHFKIKAVVLLKEAGVYIPWERSTSRCSTGVVIFGLEYPLPKEPSQNFVNFCDRLEEDLDNFEELKTYHYPEIF